jgi:hypothetical protein
MFAHRSLPFDMVLRDEKRRARTVNAPAILSIMKHITPAEAKTR